MADVAARLMLQTKLENLRQRVCELDLHARERSSDQLAGLIAGVRRAVEELLVACSAPGWRERVISGIPLVKLDVPSEARHLDVLTDIHGSAPASREASLYQERVRSLMTALLLTEENERRRLALDLHDGLSQTIALALIKLALLRKSLKGPQAQSASEIQELVEQANNAARSISFELSPPVLHDFGLEPAVQWLVENIQARYGIAIDLEDDGQSKPIDEVTRVMLFRAIRELLINAAKHARASRVNVRLQRVEDRLSAVVEDDGVGMELSAVGKDGFGLFSIHERLSHAGGSMRIESSPGRGTKIHLCAPLASGAAKLERVQA
jgi:signal transduction histidine kinase